MAEEAVRVANDGMVMALKHVHDYMEKMREMEARQDFTGSEPRYIAYHQQWKAASDSLKEATDRLKEAREYHIKLTLGVPGAVYAPSLSKHPFFSQVGKAKEEENHMLTFPDRIPLTRKNQLYIRSAFKVIYDAAVTKEDATVEKYVVVTGTSGVGTSTFLYYVFWRMVQEKKRVFFIAKHQYFDGEIMITLSTMPEINNLEFWTENLWCLVDSADPTVIPGLVVDSCSILLATAPRVDNLHRFRKLSPPPPVFYLPLWSRDELQSIAGLYPDSTTWEHRFLVLGGIPRYVLQDVSTDPESLLRSASMECFDHREDLIRAVTILSGGATRTTVVPRLIHLHSNDPYTEAKGRYASPTAVRIIAETHWQSWHDEMMDLLAAVSQRKSQLAAALCRHIFEPHVKKLLERGGTFVCRELVAGHAEPKPQFDITIPSSLHPAIVAEHVATDQKKHQLYVPQKSNAVSMVAWMPGFGAFQINVGMVPPMKDGLTASIANLGVGGYRLFWLLPPCFFDLFTKKQPDKFDFEQFAIRIPYPKVEY